MQKKFTLALLASSALAAPAVERRQLGGLSGLPVSGALPNLPVDPVEGLPILGGLAGDVPGGLLDHHQSATQDVDPIVDHDIVTEDPTEIAADDMFNKAFAEASLAAAGTDTTQSTKDLNDAVAGVQATTPKTANSGPVSNNPLGGLGALGGGLPLRKRQFGGGLFGGDRDGSEGSGRQGGVHGDDGIPESPAFAFQSLVSDLLDTVATLLPGNDGEEDGPLGESSGGRDPVDVGQSFVKRQFGGASGLGLEALLAAVVDILTGLGPGDDLVGPFSPATPVVNPVAEPALRAPAFAPLASNAVTGRPTFANNNLIFPGDGTTVPTTIVVPTTVPAVSRVNRIVQRDDGEDDTASLGDLTSILGGLKKRDDGDETADLGDLTSILAGLKRRDDGEDDLAGLGDLTSILGGLKKRSKDDAELASLTSLLGEVGTLDKRSVHSNKTISGFLASLKTPGHTKNSTIKAHKTATKSIIKRQGGDDDFDVDFDDDNEGRGMGEHFDHPEAPAFALEGLLSDVLDSAADILPGLGGEDDDDFDGDDGEDTPARPIVPAAAAPVAITPAAPVVSEEVTPEVAPATEATAPVADAAPELDGNPLDSTGSESPEDQAAADALAL